MSYYQSAERILDPSWKYDVFLNFREGDSRYVFTSILYEAFKHAGIHAFEDDKSLHMGDEITYTLVQAIEASRVSIVVFSQSYVASKWCLDELTKIMECRSTIGQTVIPVFYNVGTEDVLNQTGPVKEAFQRHIKRVSEEKVHAWRAALTEAANLTGFEISRHSIRDRLLLRKIEVQHVYHVRETNDDESLKLFCWNAFGQETPLEEFARLAEEVVAYCGGLPLALVTIGRELFGKMKDEWENVLGRLKRCPHPDIHKVLKISFDGLNDDRQKEIFLEIASFCIGMKTEDVMQILKGAFGISEDGISFLEEQSLIAIDDQDIVRMHPLLRDMGLEIVREQSQTEAQEWKYDIFLSFRGKDTRPGFTSHLTSSLQNAAFTVFKDDDVDGLQRGERISIALLKAIGLSQCAVIVLSTNYADSKWCLQELENIMVCHRTKGQKVFPIFYGVDHLDVRYQTETSDFGRAFKSLIEGKRPVEKDKVQRWTTALVDVSNLSGRTMTKTR